MIESLEITPISEERLRLLQLLWLARLLTRLAGGYTGLLTVGEGLWLVSVAGAPKCGALLVDIRDQIVLSRGICPGWQALIDQVVGFDG